MMPEVIPREVAYGLAAVFGGLGALMWFWRPGPRWWIGVRTPWTFADRDIWDRSWSQAAALLLIMAAAALVHWILLAASVVLLIIWCISFPLFLYHRKYGTLRFWKDHGWNDYRPVARCPRCGHLQKLAGPEDLNRSPCEACGDDLSAPAPGLRNSRPWGTRKG